MSSIEKLWACAVGAPIAVAASATSSPPAILAIMAVAEEVRCDAPRCTGHPGEKKPWRRVASRPMGGASAAARVWLPRIISHPAANNHRTTGHSSSAAHLGLLDLSWIAAPPPRGYLPL